MEKGKYWEKLLAKSFQLTKGRVKFLLKCGKSTMKLSCQIVLWNIDPQIRKLILTTPPEIIEFCLALSNLSLEF